MSESDPLVNKDGGIMEKVVHAKQLSKYPSSTLIVARCLKIFVWGIVAFAVYGLISSYIAGKVSVSSSTTKVAALPLPKVVLCPVWGQLGMKLKVASATVGNLMTTDYPQWKPTPIKAEPCATFEYYKFDDEWGSTSKPRLQKAPQLEAMDDMGCVCLSGNTMLANHEIGKDNVRIGFSSSFKADEAKQLAIGFSAGNNEYPADWSYLDLNKRSIGDITLEKFEYGSNPFTGGSTISQYSFSLKTAYPVAPAQQMEGAESEVVLSFASYMITKTSEYQNKFSLWALLYLFGLLLAVLAGLSTFNLIFPEEHDPEAPKPLEPAWFIQETFGKCCACCRKRDNA